MPKYFICPMSKNIVDSVIEFNNNNFGLLPTRRQIDWDGGYVNNWTTEGFYTYVRNSSNIILERDHSGPGQGKNDDSGYLSYLEDSKYFDIIHIDPWKQHFDFKEGLVKTIEIIDFIYTKNPKIKYEISTEEAIRKFSPSEIHIFLASLRESLTPKEFNNIYYVVIQSGVGLDLVNMKNIGNFDLEKLTKMVSEVNYFGIKTKEHNGDYLSNEQYIQRFENGVNSINIGPEIAQIETLTYLEHMTNKQIDEFYEICYNSKKWERWIKGDFDFTNKKLLIQVCGHYCYQQYDLPKINDIIKNKLIEKFYSLPI